MRTKIFPLVRTGIVGAALLFGINASVLAQISVLTQHNDIARTGQNLSESILTPATVSQGDFGKIFSLPTDGQVLAQPLYVPKLSIGGVKHNVVFVATENDSVYAFDADTGGAPLWQASMLAAAHGAAARATVDPETDTGCEDLPQYGITGTPVIDPVSGTLYVVSVTFENNYAVQRLHALSILTGLEKFGGPVVISGAVAGTGTGSSGGTVTFDPKWENQRAGLLLLNGTVYVAFGAHCDFGPFHGWLMSYDALTLAQNGVFLTTPNGEGSGLWMGGAGLAADVENGQSRIFLSTGNGTYDATTPYATNTANYGDDILRLNVGNGITVQDAFTVKDQATRVANDTDLGSGGVLLLPDQPGPYPHLLVQTGKGNQIFLVNRENLGGYSTTSNNVVQELDNQDTYLWGMPAYWNGNIYTWTALDYLKQFSLSGGLLSQTPIATGLSTTTTGLGSTPSISANGTTGAILWVVDWSQYPQVLYAVDATNVASTLWSSALNTTRDSAGPNVKYSVPTVANGKVYVASTSQVMVYGILPVPNFAVSSAATSESVIQGSSATETITITDLDGFAGVVTLTGANLPAGVVVGFAAGSGNSSVATFTATPTAVPGTYAVTITGTSGSLVHSVGLSLKVIGAPTFTLSATPSSLAVQQGTAVSSTIAVAPVYGFSGSAALSISGLPTGVTASFSPASASSSSKLTLTASAGAWVGTFPVTVKGTYGAIAKTVPLTLSVTFGINLSNSQLVNRATGVCLDVNGISKSVGTQIGQWGCWGGPNQMWNLKAISAGVYSFTSINSGLVIDVLSSSKGTGAFIVQDSYASLSSQQWKLQQTVDGYFNLVNLNSGECLDGVEATTAGQAETQQNPCSTTLATQKWSLVPISKTTTANLTPAFNVNAIATNGTAVLNGGVDGAGDAFSESTVGTSYSFYGFPFIFGPPNVPDAVSSKTVNLPNGQYTELIILGLATNGSQANQTFKVTYSDGTTAAVAQGVNDWSYTGSLYSGELTALTTPYRLNADGAQVQTSENVYGFGMGLDSTRMAVSITLPSNSKVVVLAISLGN